MLGLSVEVRGRDKPEADRAGGKSYSGAAKDSKRWQFGNVTDGDSGLGQIPGMCPCVDSTMDTAGSRHT